MTAPRTEAMRHLALAQLLLACSAPSALEEAVQHAEEAARELRAIRDERRPARLRRVEGGG